MPNTTRSITDELPPAKLLTDDPATRAERTARFLAFLDAWEQGPEDDVDWDALDIEPSRFRQPKT